jgi:hypothetical protein
MPFIVLGEPTAHEWLVPKLLLGNADFWPKLLLRLLLLVGRVSSLPNLAQAAPYAPQMVGEA